MTAAEARKNLEEYALSTSHNKELAAHGFKSFLKLHPTHGLSALHVWQKVFKEKCPVVEVIGVDDASKMGSYQFAGEDLDGENEEFFEKFVNSIGQL